MKSEWKSLWKRMKGQVAVSVFSGALKSKNPSAVLRGSLIDAWQFPTLAWGDPTLPSALRRFTSEFGMG
ncbi:hypothetical protein QLY49_18940, partial [Cronobacter turicensis]